MTHPPDKPHRTVLPYAAVCFGYLFQTFLNPGEVSKDVVS